MPNQFPPVTPEVIAKWSEALDDGMGYKHVAEAFGVARSTVMRHLPGRGWNRTQIGQHAQLVQRNRAVLG